jgi:hypothetical protein
MITENTENKPKNKITMKEYKEMTSPEKYDYTRRRLFTDSIGFRDIWNRKNMFSVSSETDLSDIPTASWGSYPFATVQIRNGKISEVHEGSVNVWKGMDKSGRINYESKERCDLVESGKAQATLTPITRKSKKSGIQLDKEKSLHLGYQAHHVICGFKYTNSAKEAVKSHPQFVRLLLDDLRTQRWGHTIAYYEIMLTRQTDSDGEYYYTTDGQLYTSFADCKIDNIQQTKKGEDIDLSSVSQYLQTEITYDYLPANEDMWKKPMSFLSPKSETNPKARLSPFVKLVASNKGQSLNGSVMVSCGCCSAGRQRYWCNRGYSSGYTSDQCSWCRGRGFTFITQSQFDKINSDTITEVKTNVETRHAHPEIAALQDALDMGTVPNRSIGFAKSLVSQFLENGKLSSSQMYYVKELNTPQASRGGNPKIDALKEVHESLTGRDKNFAIDLIGGWNKYGRLSDKQMYWVGELTKKGIASNPDTTKVQDGWDAVVELFNQFEGSENGSPLKHPIITLVVDSNTKEAPAPCVPKYGTKGVETFDAFQRELVIRPLNFFDKKTRTTEAAELQFTEAERASSQDSRRFIQTGATLARGNVNRFNGSMTPSMGLPDDTWIVLQSLRADPISTIRRLGRKSGYCCFCSKHLSTDVSMTHGYGATCAKNAGLPHGKKSAKLIETEIANEVSRVVMQLEGGSWAVVCLETNSVIMTFDNKDQAENWLDEDTKVSFQNKAGELVE